MGIDLLRMLVDVVYWTVLIPITGIAASMMPCPLA